MLVAVCSNPAEDRASPRKLSNNRAGVRLNRSRTSQSDPFGRVQAESFWNSFRRDWAVARFQSVPAFPPRRASMGPRSFADVRSEPHPRAEKCGMIPLALQFVVLITLAELPDTAAHGRNSVGSRRPVSQSSIPWATRAR
jgi:hypothetical protein